MKRKRGRRRSRASLIRLFVRVGVGVNFVVIGNSDIFVRRRRSRTDEQTWKIVHLFTRYGPSVRSPATDANTSVCSFIDQPVHDDRNNGLFKKYRQKEA